MVESRVALGPKISCFGFLFSDIQTDLFGTLRVFGLAKENKKSARVEAQNSFGH